MIENPRLLQKMRKNKIEGNHANALNSANANNGILP
jgi:hypothetical protein